MNKEAQRIAIAEACGWRLKTRRSTTVLLDPEGHDLWHYDRQGNSYGPCRSWEDCLRKGSHYVYRVPDYLNDLNAMHEAEKMLVEKGVNAWWGYVGNLNRDNPTPLGTETAVHATAAQRAEAFLKTLKLWKEEE